MTNQDTLPIPQVYTWQMQRRQFGLWIHASGDPGGRILDARDLDEAADRATAAVARHTGPGERWRLCIWAGDGVGRIPARTIESGI